MKPIAGLTLLLLAGCASREAVHVIQLQPESPPAKPWSDGQVATYMLGRATAGADGTVIHEAHPMYRLEGAARPQLGTPPAFYYPPRVDTVATNAAFEQSESLRAEAAHARDQTRRLLEVTTDLGQRAAALRDSAESNRALQQQLTQALQASTSLSNRVQQLELRLTGPEPRPSLPTRPALKP